LRRQLSSLSGEQRIIGRETAVLNSAEDAWRKQKHSRDGSAGGRRCANALRCAKRQRRVKSINRVRLSGRVFELQQSFRVTTPVRHCSADGTAGGSRRACSL